MDAEPRTDPAEPRDKAAHLREHRWQKGQSGNPGGRPKGRTLTQLVREVLEREVRAAGKVTDELLAEVIVKNALSGKFPFVKEVWDRLEGKTPDKVKVEGNQDSHIVVLSVPAPRVIGEPEADYQARLEHDRQVRECYKQLPPSDQPRKIVVGDWWDKV